MTAAVPPADLTLSNWDLGGPVSEWSYRHTRDLFPTEVLTPGLAAPEDVGPAMAAAPEGVPQELMTGLISGVTIMAGGRTVFRWPDGPAGQHLLMSVSKVLASLAIGLLADHGELDYDDAVREHLPELGSQWESCLVRHVLDMTSGVECPEVGDPGAYTDPAHPFYQFEAALGWRPAARSVSPYELVLGYGRSGRPGSRYEYTSVNTFLLAWIIERITGLTYPQALQHLIWDDLALADESAICVNGSGTAVAHGGLIMTTDDLARFGTLFTRPSPSTNHSLTVPASYLAMLRTPRTSVVPRVGQWPPMAHSAGQWNLIYSDGDLYKSGFGGQGLYISPRHDVVIAFCGIPDSQSRTHRLAERCRDLTQRWPSDASTDP